MTTDSNNKPELYYELTPPSKRSTRHELDDTLRKLLATGCLSVDITDSPTGERHSSAVAAATYVKTVYPFEVLCHIRTRDYTLQGIDSFVRACSVWDVERILFVYGEGGSESGVFPSKALQHVRSTKALEHHIDLGLVYDPSKPNSLARKLESEPDFLYYAPALSVDDVKSMASDAKAAGCKTFIGVMPPSGGNKLILERIGVTGSKLEEYMANYEKVVEDAWSRSDYLVVMSPADQKAGIELVSKVIRK
ncbi:MAG: methylenetetrahydrofolate reductase [Candidatus Marsarchaeota archaeon]|nr:methylenetetrahydrofolate reductase [Candidatus Marsarchaeota archaeon]